MSKPGNADLTAAKTARKDEFYTQLADIEKEMSCYREHFKGRTVLCNCDDPFQSNFFKYFVLNFNSLGLKKLVATCRAKKPIKAVVTAVCDRMDDVDVGKLLKLKGNEFAELKGDGDFRSDECLALLDEADIAATNPPFSLFREYVSTLMERGKKFIILGSVNAVTYKEFFPLLKENKVWIGASIHSGDRAFYVPDNYPLDASSGGIDKETGRKYIRVKGVRWYTNLDIGRRHEKLKLTKRYSPKLYPKYDNYDAVNVDFTSDIPCDYAGTMGVPVTFLDKYSPDQFEIIGMGIGTLFDGNPLGRKFMAAYRAQGGTGHYSEKMIGLALFDLDGRARVPYGRILVRNRHPEAPIRQSKILTDSNGD